MTLATDRATDGPLPNTDVKKVKGTPTVLFNGVQFQGSLEDPDAFTSFLGSVIGTVEPGADGPTPSPTPTPTPTP